MIDDRSRPPKLSEALTVEVARTLDAIAALRGEFDHLASVTGNTLPFALFEWQYIWCRHFPRKEHRVSDEPLFHVVRDAAGECIAILPLILTRRRLARLSVASVGWLGDDPGITEIRTTLVKPGYEERVAAAISRSLDAAGTWDWINWTAELDPFSAAIGQRRRFEWLSAPPSYLLDLKPDWEQFRAGLKRNIRESLRHGYNSLKRDGLPWKMTVATSPNEVKEALERLFALHTLRADQQGTIVHPNRFAGVRVRNFVRDVCVALAERGVARIFQLEIAGTVVASRIGFVVGDSLYLYYSGYDPRWARYGVMTTTVAESIKHAIGLGLKTVNLSPGTDVSKTRWGPREVPHQTAYEAGARIRSRLVSNAYIKARSGTGVQGRLLRWLIPGRRNWD